MTTGKTIASDYMDLCQQSDVSVFNMLFRLDIVFLPRRKGLLISWLQSPSVVILKPKKKKKVTPSTFSSSICQEVMELDAMILVFWMLSFKPAFALSSLILIKRLRVVLSAYLRLLICLLAILIAIQLVGNKYHLWIIKLLIQIKSLLWHLAPGSIHCSLIFLSYV